LEKGVENYVLCQETNGYKNAIRYTRPLSTSLAAIKSRVLGNYGFNSAGDTKRLIHLLTEIDPDIVHLHNLHSHNCQFEALLGFLSHKNIRVFYTFHDCWAFTGYCPYFDMVDCEKWTSMCEKCPQKEKYSWIFDKSKANYLRKKEAFKNLNLTIITPSQWLANLTEKSFLHEFPVKVINNGIDLGVFHPCINEIRKRFACENRIIILGVSMGWEQRKGLQTFIQLSKDLPNNFQIMLVGTNDEIDKELPDRIISIHKTKNQEELAQIYSAADVFVNPTMEENFPTTNIEAIACGTPVITYNTGGSSEMLDERCGIIIERGNYEALLNAIVESNYLRMDSKSCVEKGKQFAQEMKFQEYINLYGI
jgi:glycosyltransferase involved in cell wall biosynthesis